MSRGAVSANFVVTVHGPHAPGVEQDLLPGLGVAPLAGGAFGDTKRTETNPRKRATLLQGGADGGDGGVQCARGSRLGDVGVLGNVFDEFGFVHEKPLLEVNWMNRADGR